MRYGTTQGAFYDYGEQGKFNIRVSIWGYVRFPGRYVVPNGSTVTDLLSYAGGPTPEAFTDEIRHYIMKEDSTFSVQIINYKDLLNNDGHDNYRIDIEKSTQLTPGDFIAVPGTERMYFKDWIGVTMSFISIIISVAILIFK